jgi:hypothetical protein
MNLSVTDVRKFMRERVAEWPSIPDVDDLQVLVDFRTQFMPNGVGRCWWCGKQRHLDVCHIVPRSDERCNLMAMCSCRPEFAYGDSCHRLTEKNWARLPEILRVKLENDPRNTSFLRIAMLRHRHFAFDDLE